MKYRINFGVLLKFQYTTQKKLDTTNGFSEEDQINYYFIQKKLFIKLAIHNSLASQSR